jgi:TFIIH basal transcription factor complex TTD-A subunit
MCDLTTKPIPGVLIQCDPSIKSIIVNIDSTNHDYIIEDLDEERVVVKETMVASLKQKLEDVSWLPPSVHSLVSCTRAKMLTVKLPLA